MSNIAAKKRELTIEQALDLRIERLSDWVLENGRLCTEEQAHLDVAAPERAYWHYGYLIALRDVKELLKSGNRPSN